MQGHAAMWLELKIKPHKLQCSQSSPLVSAPYHTKHGIPVQGKNQTALEKIFPKHGK
jgi:hypothetical protein